MTELLNHLVSNKVLKNASASNNQRTFLHKNHKKTLFLQTPKISSEFAVQHFWRVGAINHVAALRWIFGMADFSFWVPSQIPIKCSLLKSYNVSVIEILKQCYNIKEKAIGLIFFAELESCMHKVDIEANK